MYTYRRASSYSNTFKVPYVSFSTTYENGLFTMFNFIRELFLFNCQDVIPHHQLANVFKVCSNLEQFGLVSCELGNREPEEDFCETGNLRLVVMDDIKGA